MIGERINIYEINAHLGQGGMGNVFRATDNMLGREVALKMLHPQLTIQPQFLERFKKEARVLAQLLHPNIAVIYNFFEQNGNHFMVMEYVDGTNLDELLKKYRVLPVTLVVPIFIQALEGLQHAHSKNIFHRDIKPSNMMLTPDGILKLMDFGIAKVAGEQKMTQINKIVGTVEFMAPELIEGKPASVASDIYAMGITLYELLSGKLPFESNTDYNLMQAILKKKVEPPDKFNPSVPKVLNDIVLKALEKKPENRYPDARAFQRALIAAFPGYKEINLNAPGSLLQTTYSAQYAGTALTRADQELAALVAMETKVEMEAKPFAVGQFLKKNILSSKKLPFVLAGIGVFFLVLVIASVSFNKGDSSNNNAYDNINKKVLAKTDTISRTDKNNSGVNNAAPPINVVPAGNVEQPAHENAPLVNREISVRQKKKKQEKNEEAEIKKIEKPVEKKESEIPVVKQAERKEIYIDSKIEVSLYLQENLGESDRQKERDISFSVTSPVVYRGVVIIKQGAIAKGEVRIGRLLSTVNINSVMGANGHELSLKSARFHRTRKGLESDRNYSATLERGLRMVFE